MLGLILHGWVSVLCRMLLFVFIKAALTIKPRFQSQISSYLLALLLCRVHIVVP